MVRAEQARRNSIGAESRMPKIPAAPAPARGLLPAQPPCPAPGTPQPTPRAPPPGAPIPQRRAGGARPARAEVSAWRLESVGPAIGMFFVLFSLLA